MALMHSLRGLFGISALCVASLAVAQPADPGKTDGSADKPASKQKASATKKPVASKRLDFAPSTPVTGAAAQSVSPTATQLPGGTPRQQSHCHHGGSDA